MAQLVAHLHGMEGVEGSNPSSSTSKGFGRCSEPFFMPKNGFISQGNPYFSTIFDTREYDEIFHKMMVLGIVSGISRYHCFEDNNEGPLARAFQRQ